MLGKENLIWTKLLKVIIGLNNEKNSDDSE